MNKYLEKISELLPPVDDSYIPTEDLSPERLAELFKIFRLLPGDSPLGQPDHITKFVRTKLRE